MLEAEQIPRETPYIPHILTEGELESLFSYMDELACYNDIRDRVIPVLYRMMYCCALRPAEPLNLKRQDVDFAYGTIAIRNSKKHSSRILKMSEDLWMYCKDFNQIAGDRQWFFSRPDGGKFTPIWSRYQLMSCWKKSGLEALGDIPRPYDFRHSAASRIIMNWQDENKPFESMVMAFQTFMGHKNIKDPLYYLHLLPERLLSSPSINWSVFEAIYPEV